MTDDLSKLDAMWDKVEQSAPGETMFDPIPDGKLVRVAVVNQEFKRIPNEKQTAVVKLQLEVQEGQYEGKYVFGDLWLTENNAGNLKRDLAILGWKGRKVSQLADPSDTSLMSLGAEIVVKLRKYNDAQGNEKVVNDVKYFSAPWTPPSPAGGKVDEDIPL